ncbi:multidrug ABC transporter ATP-binding protein [Tumebacillus algifaecis]|uniref:Multidrug ABC transporter ATP-binding protein n=1 Tax=Tumebacillus algifaecis TaxID=1214604 RepID=A0A223CWQ2_9BACL|nr:ABC transporter ATP-binding protein [Tumebacillus algifaecis]ASS73634.1 multidrug ABC transporter ATP-binding protein [Tumebacillus algifaecis]
MWGLRAFLKPYWKFALLGPLFMLFEVFFDLLQPMLAARIVNFGVVERDFTYIEHTGFMMVAVALLSLLTGVACNFFASRASQNFGADIREALFKKIQTFSFENMDAFQSGSLITRMTNDVVQVQNLMQTLLQGLVRAPGLLIGSVVMALLINQKLGLILLGTLVLLVVVLVLLIRFSAPLFMGVQAKLDAVNTRMQENLAGIRVVKAFDRSDFETKRFTKVNRDYTEISIKAARYIALNLPIVTIIMNTCLVIILLYGGNLVWMKSVQVGDLVAFVNYVVQVLSSLIMVSGLLMGLSQSNVSAKRILEVLNTQPRIETAMQNSVASVPAQHVKFENVAFSYSGSADSKELVLRDINLEAEQGETVAIIGATGAGKSTLVQLIPRLYDATSGSIRMDGQDIRELPLLELRRQIGMILQESFLFTGTIRDNIAFGKSDATQEEIEVAAKIAQAHDFISRLSDGYDTVLGQKGVNLSGGQKQRISIARALLIKPPILIMDDSTSALDLGTEKLLQHALRDLMKNSITFLIAQRITSVIEAEKILVIEEGAIVGSGAHDELMSSCEVYMDIYRSQFGQQEVPDVQQQFS